MSFVKETVSEKKILDKKKKKEPWKHYKELHDLKTENAVDNSFTINSRVVRLVIELHNSCVLSINWVT